MTALRPFDFKIQSKKGILQSSFSEVIRLHDDAGLCSRSSLFG